MMLPKGAHLPRRVRLTTFLHLRVYFMEIPILKIPFDEADADFICGALRDMLLTGRLAMGPRTKEFEEQFAAFCGSEQAVACGNGTAALEMICRALEVEGGSVAVPALTFMATALAPVAAGARIILVDCDPLYLQMDPEDLARKIRPDTRAVIAVHLGGFVSPHLRRLQEIADSAGAVLIEDAAHAHGAEVEDRKAGQLGLAAAFSFYPTKVLTTAEGGMVTTSEAALADRLRWLRQHGQSRPGSNQHQEFGLNYRPSEIHSLLGLAMMKKAAWILESRRRAAAIYDELLKDGPLRPIKAPPGQKPAYYKYIALLPEGMDREKLKKRLKDEHKISLTGEVYSLPLNKQPYFKKYPEKLAIPLASLPHSESAAERQICLPLYPGLSPAEQAYVADRLIDEVKKGG